MSRFSDWASGVKPEAQDITNVLQLLEVGSDQDERREMLDWLQKVSPAHFRVFRDGAPPGQYDAFGYPVKSEVICAGADYAGLLLSTPWISDEDWKLIRNHDIGEMAQSALVGGPEWMEQTRGIEQRWQHGLAFIKMLNSTPEADGSRKVYYLRVSVNIVAQPFAAVANSYGYESHGFFVNEAS